MLGFRIIAAASLFAGLLASPAAAQQGEPAEPSSPPAGESQDVQWQEQQAPDSDVSWEESGSSADLDDPTLEEEQAGMGSDVARGPNDPYEDPLDEYWFLGVFYRHTWTPAFVLELFLDEITTANNPATGIEATYRKDNLDITATFFWQGYNTYGPFLASGDPPSDTEMINSSLSMIGIGANFLWSTAFNDVFSLQYGIDLGVGVVLGDLERNEAYPESDGSVPGQKGGWGQCEGPGTPATNTAGTATGAGSGFCETSPIASDDGEQGEHYNIKAHRWSDGGSVPNVWFRLALPHLALRIKPIRQLVMRVDFGFDIFSGFFLGAAAAVGLN